MLHPSYTELMDLINQDSDEDTPVVGSRYSVVMAAAKRARQLIDGKTGLPEEDLHKPLSTAVQELWDGDIRIVREDTDMEDENEIREDMDKEIEGFLPDEQEAEKLYAEEHPGEKDPFLKKNSEDEDEKASDASGADQE
ncbi:DNA-directed RNA polymerase subunit omega [Porcincola intestinalis]|uniref:DNA-directed RNA polymerase subunit omega n=1 Tax=Porcincola intestinalis TaxID=2606632 RepID=A0A6L5X8H3_9FIRM|nr:DNA-directed RNA polymerase subunit omega [Porcincola intestinalis]MDY5578759.1 DNA-directed RNA polymerase subunit omega [Porcincola intestinalis]MSS14742.1 DNA-directed RNA polymerase subunit omega [Porcincola intestinalis]